MEKLLTKPGRWEVRQKAGIVTLAWWSDEGDQVAALELTREGTRELASALSRAADADEDAQ